MELSSYQHNDEITFDTFLMPHHSGMGEVYRDMQDAKMKKMKR